MGIAADDFQFPPFGQPFTANINGATNAALTDVFNGLDQSGPQVQFFTIGISPASLLPSHILTLRIDEGGDGGDGWAVDFLTVGVTVSAPSIAPEPGSLTIVSLGVVGLWPIGRRVRQKVNCEG